MIHDDEVAPMFLGLDGSTQALKASLLTSTLDVRRELAVNFDADLPHYKTKGGVHHGPDGQVHSPVEMVIEAFDVLFGRMKEQGWPLGEVRGIAAAGQVSHRPFLGTALVCGATLDLAPRREQRVEPLYVSEPCRSESRRQRSSTCVPIRCIVDVR
jgi:hypothetical protein